MTRQSIKTSLYSSNGDIHDMWYTNSINMQKNNFVSPPTKYINCNKSTTTHLNGMFVTYNSSHIILLHHQIKKMHIYV